MKHLENIYMLIAWAAGVFLQVLVTEIPYFVNLFGTSRLSLSEWGILALLSCMPLAVHELLILSDILTGGSDNDILKNAGEGQKEKQGGGNPGEIA